MSDVCGDRDDVATIEQLEAERDTLQNKVYELEHTIQHWETDYKYWKDDVQELTAERDALREIVDHMTKHGVPPEHSYEVLRADNERLRAEVASITDRSLNRSNTIESLNKRLTELREAAERVRVAHFSRYPCGCDACGKLEAAIAKRDELRRELSVVMKERRDALQRAWNAEPEVERLREAAEAVYRRYNMVAWEGDEAKALGAVLAELTP